MRRVRSRSWSIGSRAAAAHAGDDAGSGGSPRNKALKRVASQPTPALAPLARCNPAPPLWYRRGARAAPMGPGLIEVHNRPEIALTWLALPLLPVACS